MNNYKGSIELISGLTQKNGNDFPLLNTEQIQSKDNGEKLSVTLETIEGKVDGIPENVSELTNDSGYQTASEVEAKLKAQLGSYTNTDDLKIMLADYAKSADVTTEIANKITEVINGAPDSFDTLKEISDWISTHETSAATMNTAIQTNKTNLEKHIADTDVHVTSTEKTAWNKKSDFSGSYNDLTDKPVSLKSPNKLTFTGAVTAEYDGSEAVSVNIPSGGSGTGSDVTIDTTLTQSGQAADAKVTGDKISDLDDDKVSKSVLYDILHDTPHVETIADYYDAKRTGKVYQTKIWKFDTNPTSSGVKLLDNADLNFEPSTDTVEGTDDYADIPLFQWLNVNYLRKENGAPYPVAIEGDGNYATTGSVDVGAMQMSFYWNWDASNAEYDLVTISDMPNDTYGLKPWSECVYDDEVLPWCIGSKYQCVEASDGLWRSQPNASPVYNVSYNEMITNFAKKGTGYTGAGAERNTFQIIFNIIKGATKNSQNLYAGCSNYNFQYTAAVESSDAINYFPVTIAQAANIIVGGCVSVGYGSSTDRNTATMHSYVNRARVSKIEALDDTNSAVYFDQDVSFTTTPVESGSSSYSIYISSMPQYTGMTDSVIGHHDGSPVSNTNSKYPYRVQGREYMLGQYIIASDTVMINQSDNTKKVYVSKHGIARSSTQSVIESTYTNIGIMPVMTDGYIKDISVDYANNTGSWYPNSSGAASSTGYGDYIWFNSSSSGLREYLQGGHLGIGSSAGSVCLHCGRGLGNRAWDCGGAD